MSLEAFHAAMVKGTPHIYSPAEVAPFSYIVFRHGDFFYLRETKTGKLLLNSPVEQTVLQFAIDRASSEGGGTVDVKPGRYNARVTVKDKVYLIIERGATGISYTIDSGATCTIEDLENGILEHYEAGSLTRKLDLSAGELTLNKLIMQGDINLGAYKLKTTNLLIKEYDLTTMTIRDRDDTAYRNFLVNVLFVCNRIRASINDVNIASNSDSSAILRIQSHDGSAYVDNLKLVGEPYKGN